MNASKGNVVMRGVDGTFRVEALQGHVELQVNNLHARESSLDDATQAQHDSSVRAASIDCLLDPEVRPLIM